MADTKISSLTESTSSNNGDFVLIIQSGVPKKSQLLNLLPAGVIKAAKIASYEINSSVYGDLNTYATGAGSDVNIEDIFFGPNLLRAVGDIIEIECLFYVATALNTGVAKLKINDSSDVNKSSHASDSILGSSADYVKFKSQVIYIDNANALVVTEIFHYASGYANAAKSKIFRSAITGMSFSTGFRVQTAAYAASGSPVITCDFLNIRLIRKI